MLELFQGNFCFLSMFACKDENVDFFSLQVYCVIDHERPREDEKNETFPDSQGFICPGHPNLL